MAWQLKFVWGPVRKDTEEGWIWSNVGWVLKDELVFVKWTGKSGVGRTFWVEGTVCAVTQRTTKPGISASVGQRVEVGGLKLAWNSREASCLAESWPLLYGLGRAMENFSMWDWCFSHVRLVFQVVSLRLGNPETSEQPGSRADRTDKATARPQPAPVPEVCRYRPNNVEAVTLAVVMILLFSCSTHHAFFLTLLIELK